jgi:hypothetical protein
MKQIISYRQTFIRDCSFENKEFLALFHIFQLTLKPGMQFREFKAYYSSAKLDYIDVTFVICNQTVIGFCAAAFYETIINNKPYTIGRAATGIMEQYRGHTLPKWKLYKKYMHYWWKHPFRHFVLSAYVANPLIYAMICKYTGIAYPRPATPSPVNILQVKDELLRSQNLHLKEKPAFVVEIHFCVSISDKEQERIFKSNDGAVQYFLKINPKFREQHGVLVIIPVNLKNITWTSCKFLYYRNAKIIFKAYNTFKRQYSTKEKINFT